MSILNDIAALAKAGYKFEEVKELISMSKNNVSNSDETETIEVSETTEEPETIEVSEEPDYKSMYMETKKELSALQSKNTKTEVEEVSYTIDDLVSSMSKSI